MQKTNNTNNRLKIFLIFLTTFFAIVIFLSIPVLYNYKSLQNRIEKEFYSEFKIDLEILGEIKRKNFPHPHIIIEKANLKLKSANSVMQTVETKDLKIVMPYKNLLSKSNFEIVSVEILNSNLKFKYADIKNLRNHLYYKINKPIIIKKSKFFYLDKNNETILILPIENLNYLINTKNKTKELKIKGNIFDTNFNSMWIREYKKPNQTSHKVKFKNPDLIYNSFFKLNKKNNFNGIASIKFLDEEFSIEYYKKNQKIYLNFPSEKKNQSIKIISDIELNPFYFDANIIFKDKNFQFILDYFLYKLLSLKSESLGNINGKLNINLENIDNSLFRSGKIKILIDDQKIQNKEVLLELDKIGIIKSELNFKEENNKVSLISSNILEIENIKEFARRFQINIKKVQNINQIYFDLQKDIDSNLIYLSNININLKNKKKLESQFYVVKNLNELKFVVKKILNN